MEEYEFSVTFLADPDPLNDNALLERQTEIVTVLESDLTDGQSPKEQAVVEADNQSPYEHVETQSIERLDE